MSSIILRRISNSNTNINVLLKSLASNKVYRFNSSNIIHSALRDIPKNNVTIQEYVYQNFNKYPHKIAVECGLTGKKFTFEEVRAKSRNLNRALRKKLKLQKGDVVALLLPNIPEYPICVLGVLEAALVVTPINPLYTPEEINRQLIDSGAKAFITLGSLWPSAQAAVKLMPKQIPILTIKMLEAESTPEGSISFVEFTDTRLDIEEIPPLDLNDVVLLPYSSGTTGLPKGVELTHNNMVANFNQIADPYLALAEPTTDSHQDVVPGILPWFHIYGITAVLFNNMINLSKMVTLPKFTPELYLQTLIKHKPHILYIVPPIVLFMSNHPSIKPEYLEPIRSVVSGAAPLGALDEQKFLKKAGKPMDILQGYGLTETSPCVFMTSRIRKREINFVGTAGETVGSTLTKVLPVDNLSAEALGPNQPGELLVKGPQVMKGYHNNPSETKEAFLDGWLRTGDMVYYDDNNMFYVTDRLKELIKVKGFQVAPAELEAIIRSHPVIADAAVIGVPHDLHGEVPRAYVVFKQNTKIEPAKLQEFVAEKVATYKQLKGGVEVLDAIPKNASGKIMRRNLKLQYEKEHR